MMMGGGPGQVWVGMMMMVVIAGLMRRKMRMLVMTGAAHDWQHGLVRRWRLVHGRRGRLLRRAGARAQRDEDHQHRSHRGAQPSTLLPHLGVDRMRGAT